MLHKYVSAQCEVRSNAVAVRCKDERLTYGELEEQSNQLANLLLSAGCRKGDRVALLLPKDISAVVAIVGILKAGCVYVPMDKACPAARIAKVLNIAGPSVVLAVDLTAALLQDSLSLLGGGRQIRLGWLDNKGLSPADVCFSKEDFPRAQSTAVECGVGVDDFAHILFTSGSTGLPKGVTITHSNVIHFLNWANRNFRTSACDRISCHAPLHFDLSTFDIWAAFSVGATLCLLPPEAGLLPQTTAKFIRDNAITQWCSVPSALRYMLQFNAIRFGDFPALRHLIWAGEVLPTPILRSCMERLPHVAFTNMYGPTEATISSSYYRIPSIPERDDVKIPIGSPCDGEELLVLNDRLQDLPTETTDGLYIRGVGLSPGYWDDRQRTDSVFLNHPKYGRIYRTGDLAYKGADGLIYFQGRADSQIKSRGYRIELGEIESALYTIEGLQVCAVVALETDNFEGTAICCAYVTSGETIQSVKQLRDQLATLLPSYMIPVRWIQLERMPANLNGKVDRAAIKELFSSDGPPGAKKTASQLEAVEIEGRTRRICLEARNQRPDSPAHVGCRD